MDQLKKLFASLSQRQRLTIAAAAILAVLGLVAFSRWRHDRDFRPLFTGVAAEDASGIIEKLKESGVEYRLSEDGGSTILVPSSRLAELRLQMAGAGLPKTGRIGFELFDRTNLGATDFAEHINYGRALEGEIERSIRSISAVELARVHITFPKESIFVESRLPAKASVLLRVKAGGKVSPQNVLAICHLVASAVEGLSPEAVSVLDMRGSLLSRPRRNGGPGDTSEEALEHRQKLERDMLAKLQSTLEPLLGHDKFRTSVALDCDLSSGEESQETYDPERTVMLTTQKSEESAGGSSSSGVPGTASNMPRPPSRPSIGGSGLVRRTENVSYQPSKTIRRVLTPQGNIKRISIAILIDHAVRWEEKDRKLVRTIIPPAPETLKTIRDVVSAAVGLDQQRGDQLVVESLPFEATISAEPPQASLPQASPAAPQGFVIPFDIRDKQVLMAVAVIGIALFCLLAGILFVLLRRRRAGKARRVTVTPQVEGGPEVQQLAGTPPGDMKKQLEEHAEQKRQMVAEAQHKLKLQPVQTPKAEVLAGYLRESVANDPQTAAGVIRSWLNEE